jgi:hypothetical protein
VERVVRIVFARTRHVYPSYTDFWRLVEAAGFATCFIDEINLGEPITYVTTPWNGETVPAVRDARAWGDQGKLVWWLLERDAADAGMIDPVMVELFDEVWVSDRSYANLNAKFRHVVLGGHPLFGDPSLGKQYDVCHLAYLWGRRRAAVDEMIRRGRTVAPEAFGKAQQDRFVATSRLMLSMHQYETARIIAPIRFAVAASYNLPLVSEGVVDAWPLIEGRDFLQAPIEQLPDLVDRVLGDVDLRQRLAIGLRSRLVLEHPFGQEVERAVDLLWRKAFAS